MTRSAVRQWIVTGRVKLGDRTVKIPTRPLRSGDWISVEPGPARVSVTPQIDLISSFSSQWIRFEDEDLIVVDKPAGLPTQPTLDPKRPNLFHLLQEFRKHRQDADPYVGLHHRLDRDTSGLVLFTKRKEANLGVSKLFKDHEIQKTYVALCVPPMKGSPATKDSWRAKNFLKKVTLPGKKNRMKAVSSGGDLAITDFEVMKRFPKAVLIQARPLTGRMHQIRTHLQESGTSIFGDADYGYRGAEKFRVMLHAGRLNFKHPVSNRVMEVEAPIPQDMADLIQKLKA